MSGRVSMRTALLATSAGVAMVFGIAAPQQADAKVTKIVIEKKTSQIGRAHV